MARANITNTRPTIPTILEPKNYTLKKGTHSEGHFGQRIGYNIKARQVTFHTGLGALGVGELHHR